MMPHTLISCALRLEDRDTLVHPLSLSSEAGMLILSFQALLDTPPGRRVEHSILLHNHELCKHRSVDHTKPLVGHSIQLLESLVNDCLSLTYTGLLR